MTENGAIRAIESIAEAYYHDTKDKWWLKLAIYAEKRLNETQKQAERKPKRQNSVAYNRGVDNFGSCAESPYFPGRT